MEHNRAEDAADDGALPVGPPTLDLHAERRGESALVSLRGELDLSTAPPLRELLARIFADEPPESVVVDLSDLGYLDSTGLSVFVTVQKRAKAAGIDFRLSNPNPSVRRLFQITALDQFFTLEGGTASGAADADDQSEGGGLSGSQ